MPYFLEDGSIDKSISDNPELESSARPATRRREESPVPGDMVDQSVVPVVNISPTNVFAVELGQRWRGPPLSYYTMVSAKTVVILDRLAQWPTALVRHQTFQVPSYVVVPASSLVLADLIAMGDDLINYQELSAEAEMVREPVSAVLDVHLKSTLMEPWRPGKRIVTLLNITATDKGMLKCRLDWNGLLEQLGPQFAFTDYEWMYAEAELGKLFPFTSTKKGGKVRVDAERTEYLKKRGKRPWVASVQTAPGWLSDMHIDFAGLASGIAHIDGEKLWLFWPPTFKNLRWWGVQYPHSWTGHGSRIADALDALEGLEVLHITDPVAFVVPPFHIHAVISFQNLTHSCVAFAHAIH
ncbi:hypothetical protein C8F04DRAFT_1265321 [Mycena alexandri]|uniref:JmjC domain-containing protein n=1 Tax=Mycena alexandri TaxID=1745969 RepID=A0AAD6WY93_9AGAR|nr:hypothetical protein C8F04DRAFT_1265321 [Mycena alexandri]